MTAIVYDDVERTASLPEIVHEIGVRLIPDVDLSTLVAQGLARRIHVDSDNSRVGPKVFLHDLQGCAPFHSDFKIGAFRAYEGSKVSLVDLEVVPPLPAPPAGASVKE